MGMSTNGQPDLARVSSRQCRCTAACWNAGNHIEAFESPTTATVVVDAVSPVAHSGCSTSGNSAHAAIRDDGGSFGRRVDKRRVEVRWDGLHVGGCRDRGLHLRERVPAPPRRTGSMFCAREDRRRSDRQRRSRQAAADRVRHHAAVPRPDRPLARWRHRRPRDCGWPTGARERRIGGGSR